LKGEMDETNNHFSFFLQQPHYVMWLMPTLTS
jgi:hypothetical protein